MNKIATIVILSCIVGCNASSTGESNNANNFLSTDSESTRDTTLDTTLSIALADESLTGNPAHGLNLISIDSPLAQLGMKLFYSKSLGGEMDSACVSCHHPALGGGDNLSLGIGVHALDDDVLGPGRLHSTGIATVPRNAPTTFNTALYRRSLFWDSRVTQLDAGIRTPDSAPGTADPFAGESLLTAQARFPVTSAEEMRTENFEHGKTNTSVRDHLAARLGAYDGGFGAQTELQTNNWEIEFQTALGSSESAESLVTYDNIARALAAYQASQVFIDNPWNRYLKGDKTAISDNAKRGAILFFTAKEDNGGDCSRCHQGDHFTDESHHVVAFPQTGPGKGNGLTADDDFGLERESGDARDRYKFRTPSLLNIAMTAPYGHTGAYKNLHEVINHYHQPESATDLFLNPNWCRDASVTNPQSCDYLYPNAKSNTEFALQALANQQRDESIENIDLSSEQVDQLVQFLETLTDPCTQNRACLAPWIPVVTGGPDGNQLNALDQFGNRL